MTCEDIGGVILAGGQARRMGGTQKGFCAIGGKTLLTRVIERLAPQVGYLALNVPHKTDEVAYQSYAIPLFHDVVDGFFGPLAGILTSMETLSRRQDFHGRHFVSCPVDTPFIPRDMVTRFYRRMRHSSAQIVCAASRGRVHPVCALWPLALASDLRHALLSESVRKIDRWTARYSVAVESFDDKDYDPFFNINSDDERRYGEALLSSIEGEV
ncbi:MAG: molybdenum cofactor guanylyltransferase MobA [Alphaproteobacteria bacterium GM7ARS4]|nr:molybdenum cofactor guanylyltransferase MobA [Alphaproteobacteria bacterium GM7ARS4]